jgi:hypothetical protein
VAAIKRPTFYLEGEQSFATDVVEMERRAREAGVPFEAFPVKAGNHFNILAPMTELVAKKILADTGSDCSIRFSAEELVVPVPRPAGMPRYGGRKGPAKKPAPTAPAKETSKTPLPLNVVRGAKLGDWAAYRTSTVIRIGRKDKGTEAALGTITWTIRSSDARSTLLEEDWTTDQGTKKPVQRRPLSREDPTAEELFASKSKGVVENAATEDSEYSASGKTFACKKLTYTERDPSSGKASRVELWFSRSVRAAGLVAMRMTVDASLVTAVSTVELAGFGTSTTTEWGRRP